MNINEKFGAYRTLYFKNFLATDIPDRYIPLENVIMKNGIGQTAYLGDGSINIAHLMYYFIINNQKDEFKKCLDTFDKLVVDAKTICDKNNYPFEIEKGFFLRDNITSKEDAKRYNLSNIMSGYDGLHQIQEDVCHSPFVSQDQMWNLLPYLLKNNFGLGQEQSLNMLDFLYKNKGTVYNPYYSWTKHIWNYCNLKMNYPDRIKDRIDNFKNTVKVKRGAWNPQLYYGFLKVYKSLGKKIKWYEKLLYAPLYYLTVYGAEFIYYPLMKKYVPVKNNSWHCLMSCIDEEQGMLNRMVEKFNESLGRNDLEPEFWNLVCTYKHMHIDRLKLLNWLENYPEPILNGKQSSPIIYMTLYKYFNK